MQSIQWYALAHMILRKPDPGSINTKSLLLFSGSHDFIFTLLNLIHKGFPFPFAEHQTGLRKEVIVCINNFYYLDARIFSLKKSLW